VTHRGPCQPPPCRDSVILRSSNVPEPHPRCSQGYPGTPAACWDHHPAASPEKAASQGLIQLRISPQKETAFSNHAQLRLQRARWSLLPPPQPRHPRTVLSFPPLRDSPRFRKQNIHPGGTFRAKGQTPSLFSGRVSLGYRLIEFSNRSRGRSPKIAWNPLCKMPGPRLYSKKAWKPQLAKIGQGRSTMQSHFERVNEIQPPPLKIPALLHHPRSPPSHAEIRSSACSCKPSRSCKPQPGVSQNGSETQALEPREGVSAALVLPVATRSQRWHPGSTHVPRQKAFKRHFGFYLF